MNSPTPPPGSASAYSESAALLDDALDRKIASIRRRSDSGQLSVRQAADLRIAAMEQHLEASRELRWAHFGGDQ